MRFVVGSGRITLSAPCYVSIARLGALGCTKRGNLSTDSRQQIFRRTFKVLRYKNPPEGLSGVACTIGMPHNRYHISDREHSSDRHRR